MNDTSSCSSPYCGRTTLIFGRFKGFFALANDNLILAPFTLLQHAFLCLSTYLQAKPKQRGGERVQLSLCHCDVKRGRDTEEGQVSFIGTAVYFPE